MKDILHKIAFKINPKVYKKDPLSSDLGGNILRYGVNLMEEIGFENFTFKKLSNKISCTEASIYRYFESKHNLLAYLTMWYWSWTEYRIVIQTLNIESPQERLIRAIKSITQEVDEDKTILQIDEKKLHQIIIAESTKVYLNKSVDADNASGFFLVYKSLVQRIADIILEIDPSFKYPHMFVSTVIEGANHQRYFAAHLPKLTDFIEGEDAVTSFYIELTKRTLKIG